MRQRGRTGRTYVGHLYAQYHDPLTSFVRKQIGDEQDTADLIQDVFVRVARLDDPLRLQENAKAFLYKTAVNLIRDRARLNKSRHFDAHDLVEEIAIESDFPSPENEVVWRQAWRVADRKLAQAGVRLREIVLLSCLHDLTHPEIAARLGVTTRTVERGMQRARFCCSDLRFEAGAG